MTRLLGMEVECSKKDDGDGDGDCDDGDGDCDDGDCDWIVDNVDGDDSGKDA